MRSKVWRVSGFLMKRHTSNGLLIIFLTQSSVAAPAQYCANAMVLSTSCWLKKPDLPSSLYFISILPAAFSNAASCRFVRASTAVSSGSVNPIKIVSASVSSLKYVNEDTEAETILMGLTEPDETAVLARTNRQLAAFEKAAGKMEMKYKLLGKSGFFSQHEVESTIAFAQYCAGAATDDCVKKIIRSPFDVCRFIKKPETLQTLERMQAGQVGRSPYARLLSQFHSGDPEQ